ncbi:MAG: sensor histidine kinase [Candidatus Binatia bacterium]
MSAIRPLRAIAAEANRERLRWAVLVRWLAIVGFSGLALVAWRVGMLATLRDCLIAGGGSAVVNTANHWCVARRRGVRAITALAIAADVLLITYLIAQTGGVRSPFLMLYVVQVVATAMLVDLWVAAASALASVVCFVAALWLGLGGPAVPPVGLERPAAQAVWGLFLLYCLALLTYLGGYVAERLRRSEDDLAERHRRLQAALAARERAHAELQATVARLQATEAQLVQSEKMRALGQFVAGIAHELNNPIGFVSANLEHLRRSTGALERMLAAYAAVPLAAGDAAALAAQRRSLRLDALLADLPCTLDDCREGVRRAAEIVAALRAFARGDAAEAWGRIDLRERLERTLALLRHRLVDVTVERDYSDVPPVEVVPGQIDQVLLNLIANALDAMAARGTLGVCTRLEVDPPGAPHAGPHVVVRVRDTGAGIAPELQARVFDPFFTTKPEGRGTGLGLSVSYGIVERHGGHIGLESQPGRGTTFTVALPLARPAAPVARLTGSAPPS